MLLLLSPAMFALRQAVPEIPFDSLPNFFKYPAAHSPAAFTKCRSMAKSWEFSEKPAANPNSSAGYTKSPEVDTYKRPMGGDCI